MAFSLNGRLIHGKYARFNDLDLDARSWWLGREKLLNSAMAFKLRMTTLVHDIFI